MEDQAFPREAGSFKDGLKDEEEETYRKHFSSKMLPPAKDQSKSNLPD